MNNPPQQIHLLDYLNLMRKRKWLIIACVFITVTTVIIGNYTITPIYESKAQLVIDKEKGKSVVTGDDLEYLDYESYLSEELTFNTQFKMVSSYPVMERVVRNLKLKERYEKEKDLSVDTGMFSSFKANLRENINTFKQSVKETITELIKNLIPAPEQTPDQKDEARAIELSPEEKTQDELMTLVQTLKGKIKAEQITETRLVDISVTDEDPLWAQKIANGLVEAYIEYDMSSRISAAQKFVDWISSQINEMKDKLVASEKAFFDFKSENKIFSIKEKQGIDTSKIGELNASYIKVRTERMEMQARIAELDRIMGRRNEKSLGSDLLNDPLLAGLHKDLTSTQIELEALKARYKEKHPKILDLVNRLEILKQEFNNKLKKAYDSLQIEDSILRSREDALQYAIKKYEEEALMTNQKEIGYAVLEREVETNKTIHEIMLNKMKETQINESMGKSNVRLVEPASLPKSPVKPNKKLNIILGFILGLMSGVGMVFLMEYMETSIKTEEDVEEYLHLPVLGIVPEAQVTEKSKVEKSRERKKDKAIIQT